MFDNNRSSYKKKSEFLESNNQNKQYNQNNLNNQNNKDMLSIVIPGHYCSNDTLNAKVKNIIRIIGPDINRNGYWKTQDGKSINESIILDEYTLLSTASHEAGSKFTKSKNTRNRKKDIMKGFKPTNKSNIKDEYDDYYEPEIEEKPIVYKQPTHNQSNSPYDREIPEHLLPDNNIQRVESKSVEKPKDPFQETKILIEKASIDSLNNNYEKKYGSKPYKPIKLEIPITIEIPYELNKLSQICELFDIDTKTVAQIILQKVRLPEEIIFDYIQQELNGQHISMVNNMQQSNNTQPNNIIPNTNETVVIKEENENQEKIDEGIENIDNYIKSMFGN